MRPTAEGLEEQNRNKPKSYTPQQPQVETPAEPAAATPEPAPPEPESERPSFSEAPREWRHAEPIFAERPEPVEAAGASALPSFLEPLDDEAEEAYDDEEEEGAEEEIEASEVDREAREEKEEDDKEGDDKDADRRKRRSRGRRGGRRRNGKTPAAAGAAAVPEPAEEEDDEEESWRDEPAFEEQPAPAPRRIGHAPAPSRYVISPSEVESVAREIVISVPDRQRADHERKIAMFCDLENIALGVRDSEISKFDISLILERLVEKGKIIVKKAYADWERYSDYKRQFHESAIELIDIPQKYYSGKNSADIKMVVDAMDLSYSKEHLDTFVLLSGDSDFSPLVSKLKENNKYVIGIGVKNSSSNLLIDNCDEFIYYEDVWRDSQKGPKLDGLNKKTAEAFSLMIESIQALIRENKDVLWGSMIKQTMQRKRPSFNEGYYGYSTFSELLEDAERKQIIKLKKDQRSGTYIVTGFAKTGDGMVAVSRR